MNRDFMTRAFYGGSMGHLVANERRRNTQFMRASVGYSIPFDFYAPENCSLTIFPLTIFSLACMFGWRIGWVLIYHCLIISPLFSRLVLKALHPFWASLVIAFWCFFSAGFSIFFLYFLLQVFFATPAAATLVSPLIQESLSDSVDCLFAVLVYFRMKC